MAATQRRSQQAHQQQPKQQLAAHGGRPQWVARTLDTATGALRFTAMTVVGMVAVWALVLLFG